jgi:hypothetical protein
MHRGRRGTRGGLNNGVRAERQEARRQPGIKARDEPADRLDLAIVHSRHDEDAELPPLLGMGRHHGCIAQHRRGRGAGQPAMQSIGAIHPSVAAPKAGQWAISWLWQ